ncbi:MAG: hypothetical protein AAGH19_10610, partial [Pseudomonadota bacterium]
QQLTFKRIQLMAKTTLTDLAQDEELDMAAMQAVTGGWGGFTFSTSGFTASTTGFKLGSSSGGSRSYSAPVAAPRPSAMAIVSGPASSPVSSLATSTSVIPTLTPRYEVIPYSTNRYRVIPYSTNRYNTLSRPFGR